MSIKTELEKMRSAELYDFSDPAIEASLRKAKALCARLQSMSPYDSDFRPLIEELIPGIPASATICPPLYCDHGHGIRLGEGVFINYNCTMLDGGLITIGARTLIGPNCQFYTPNHPIDYIARRATQETALPITIGEDCWLGGGVIVTPGTTIGDRVIVAAGSVVKGNIPSDVLVAGNPATIKKHLK